MPTLAETPVKALTRYCPACLGKFKTTDPGIFRQGKHFFHECAGVRVNDKLVRLRGKKDLEVFHAFYMGTLK
jgi:hypothetical protein